MALSFFYLARSCFAVIKPSGASMGVVVKVVTFLFSLMGKSRLSLLSFNFSFSR